MTDVLGGANAWVDFAGKFGVLSVLLLVFWIGFYKLAIRFGDRYLDHLETQSALIQKTLNQFATTHAAQMKAVSEIAVEVRSLNDTLESRERER